MPCADYSIKSDPSDKELMEFFLCKACNLLSDDQLKSVVFKYIDRDRIDSLYEWYMSHCLSEPGNFDGVMRFGGFSFKA